MRPDERDVPIRSIAEFRVSVTGRRGGSFGVGLEVRVGGGGGGCEQGEGEGEEGCEVHGFERKGGCLVGGLSLFDAGGARSGDLASSIRWTVGLVVDGQ